MHRLGRIGDPRAGPQVPGLFDGGVAPGSMTEEISASSTLE